MVLVETTMSEELISKDNLGFSEGITTTNVVKTTTTTTKRNVYTLAHRVDEHTSFVEYCVDDTAHFTKNPETVSVVVLANVEPTKCSRLIKAMAHELPLPVSLNHLKRVQKINHQSYDNKEEDHPATKRAKISSTTTTSVSSVSSELSSAMMDTNMTVNKQRPIKDRRIQILLGYAPFSDLAKSSSSIRTITRILLDEGETNHDGNSNDNLTILQRLEALTTIVRVPGNPPQSQQEANQANHLWPTHFFPRQSLEYRQQQWILSSKELQQMQQILQTYIFEQRRQFESSSSCDHAKVIIVDPSTQQVVATSWQEQELQSATCHNNPLTTPILLAIQGVSRRERSSCSGRRPISDTTITNSTPSKPQYLCTGYDLYCNYEPTIFEAMACTHSRLRRLIFVQETTTTTTTTPRKCPPSSMGVWHSAITQHAIHALPGTNHHYRAFAYSTRFVDIRGETTNNR